jgi:hypothetical protein
MVILKGTSTIARTRYVKNEDGRALYAEPVLESTEWTIEARDGRAVISFGFPMEYYVSSFAKNLHPEDMRPFCLLSGSNIGDTTVYLLNKEYRKIVYLLTEKYMWLKICEGLSAQTMQEKTGEKYMELIQGGGKYVEG